MINQLKTYKDRALINALLAENSKNYYNMIKNIINIPLIISNSAMVCINSIITEQELLKILNIILNTITGLILALVSSFKIYEHISSFHNLHLKYNKLYIDLEQKTEEDDIKTQIDLYNVLDNDREYDYPAFIKKRIKKQFEGVYILPISLIGDIVICS